MRNLLITSFFLTQVLMGNAQQAESTGVAKHQIGIQTQVYPAGIIPTIQGTIRLKQALSMVVRFGINIADRKDFSPINDHEIGYGLGGTLGIQRHFFLKKGQIRAGLNCDLWKLKIKWQNLINTVEVTSGRTDIVVLQPWIHGGYYYPISSSKLEIYGGLGFGREINIVTTGKEVAQGWMASAFVGLAINLN